MVPFVVEKFAFRIRTRSGSLVDGIAIHAQTADEARAKLRKMYPACAIMEEWSATSQLGTQSTSFEDVIDLITPARG